jgi:tetratricopeptide (TPR) repeat protein
MFPKLLTLLLFISCTTQLPKETSTEEFFVPKLSTEELSQLLLKTTPRDDSEYPDIVMRQCEATETLIRIDYQHLVAIEEALCCNQHPSNEAELIENEKQLHTSIKTKTQENLKNYQTIVNNYPKFPRREEAIFALGYTLNSVKKTAEAKAAYELLIQEFPKGTFTSSALLFLADEAFNDNDILQAIELYKKIEAFPEDAEYSYAVYKKAWCFYNLGNFDEAMAAFVQVVQHAQTQKNQQILLKEALRDIARVYAQGKDPLKAEEFFQSLKEPTQVPSMLKNLADLYYDQGNFTEFTELCRVNAPTYPEMKEACSQKIP